MKKLCVFAIVLFFSNLLSAQNRITSQELLDLIDKSEPISLEGFTIEGDLDLTKLENRSRGGRYGLRGGVAQEYLSIIRNELRFTNCQFEGKLITKTERKVNREIQENYTWFEAPVIFVGCTFDGQVDLERMRISDMLTIQKCIFNDNFLIKSTRFKQAPKMEDNILKGKFKNDSNWREDKSVLFRKKMLDVIEVTLQNPTDQAIRIKFNNKTWNLSPNGSSGLREANGVPVYIIEGSKKRLAFTMNEGIRNQTIDVSKL